MIKAHFFLVRLVSSVLFGGVGLAFLEGNQKKSFDPITPNAGPKVKGGQDFFLVAEFVYWTARLDSFSYAISGVDNFSNPNVSDANSHSLGWSWDPGFKVAFIKTVCNGWATSVRRQEADKGCLFLCGLPDASDRIQHYISCLAAWKSLRKYKRISMR